MAVKPAGGLQRRWHSLLQRGLDAASEFADLAAQKIAAAADPRARALRKRRWALRSGLFFGAACVFWVLVTALLASWSTPAWVLLITGLIAAGAAAPATLLLLRYHWLRGEPLPSPRPATTRRLPPLGSAARGPMVALASAERGMFSLLGVIERAALLPAGEIRELAGAANQVAVIMSATATDIVAMEEAVGHAPHSRSSLAPTIDACVARLTHGVRQYDEMVSAAAELVSTVNSGPLLPQQRYRDELVAATDRLLGWSQAFAELGRAGPARR
jgi:hypothetical protein